MSRRLYFKVDVDMPDHPKIEALSDRAFRELIRLWAWCWKHDTDGEITPARWRKLPPKVRNELINGELVDEVHSVLMVHDYLDYQQSSEERRKASGGHAKGGSLGMHNRWHAARGVVKEGCPYCEETPPNQDQQHDNSSYNSTYNSEITEKEKEEEYKYLSTRQPVRNARARHGVSGPHSTRAIRLVDRTLGRGLTSATRTALAIEVAALLSEVDEPTLIAALQRWDSRTGIGPRLLPSLVDDIRKEARGAT
ncbi:MAG: hypothetical protein QJR12_17050, partial [Mycobacterium sp.]|uniref:hypothetical protein n=1 Tax=Mycobacterium sp. TaxID=1785 RepID=UPI002616D27B